ncbi:unnamed protein product [Cunninghamella blakesleeana]
MLFKTSFVAFIILLTSSVNACFRSWVTSVQPTLGPMRTYCRVEWGSSGAPCQSKGDKCTTPEQKTGIFTWTATCGLDKTVLRFYNPAVQEYFTTEISSVATCEWEDQSVGSITMQTYKCTSEPSEGC